MARYHQGEHDAYNTRFIRRTMAAPLLTREREFQLVRAWKMAGDEAALHELIDSYLRLVVSLASKLRNYGLPMADLVQEGTVGLMQAAERFEPDRNVRFSTYAAWWIRAAMQDFILRNWSIVRTGTTAAQKSLFFNLRRLRSRIEGATGRPLDHEGRQRIAEELQVNLIEVEAMEGRLGAADHSLNETFGEDGDDAWQDVLSDEGPTPEELVIGVRDGAQRARWLHEALALLPDRERRIIEARRLAEDATTLEELGRDLGVSKERVRQLEQRALIRLRQSIASRVEQPSDLLLEA